MATSPNNNPLFLEWLLELQQVSESMNLNSKHTYKRAYDTLKACPVMFAHPQEMLALKGFGKNTCDRLEKKLKEYCALKNLAMPQIGQAQVLRGQQGGHQVPDDSDNTTLSAKAKNAAITANASSTRTNTTTNTINTTTTTSASTTDAAAASTTKKNSKAGPKKPYVPAYRSGAYAILKVLHEHNNHLRRADICLSKTEIITLARSHCDSSFDMPGSSNRDMTVGGTRETHYTAWSGIKKLLTHELVIEQGARGRKTYQISRLGVEVANAMLRVEADKSGTGQLTPHRTTGMQQQQHQSSPSLTNNIDPVRRTILNYESPQRHSAQTSKFGFHVWQPGSFTVEIIVDVREVASQNDRDYFVTQLNAIPGVTASQMALGIGDMVWVARHVRTGQLIVLEHVAERKRIDDLTQSIRDGRFHEQKYRLSRSGLPNVIYIVEEYPGVDLGNYYEAVQTAITATQVIEGFFLKRTTGLEETVRYLGRVTLHIKREFESRSLNVIPDQEVPDSKTYFELMTRLRSLPAAHETVITSSHHVTMAKFQSVTSKSGNLTVRDVFLRMLTTVRGVSWEKAIEIQKEFATPRILWSALTEAYRQGGEQAAKDLVHERCSGLSSGSSTSRTIARKRIGKSLSARIAEIWGTSGGM
ncbi:hypothetical protein V1514DRAFT_332176 [Lipomyces japonicus]|uniref:uncharacterized protein n=1 Tax=Lipomyces japonicus TaxID=56871 RepID=UPI0034CF2B58